MKKAFKKEARALHDHRSRTNHVHELLDQNYDENQQPKEPMQSV